MKEGITRSKFSLWSLNFLSSPLSLKNFSNEVRIDPDVLRSGLLKKMATLDFCHSK